MREMDEALLIQRAKRHDRVAFTELYRRHAQRIYRFIYYRVGSEFVAEDLLSEVFLSALRDIESFTDRGIPFAAWLYRIAQARTADYHRSRAKRKHVPLDQAIGRSPSSPEMDPELRLRRLDLYEALTQLTDDQQQVIILKFIEGLSNPEVAQYLGKTEGAVKSLQHRALATLQRILQGSARDTTRWRHG